VPEAGDEPDPSRNMKISRRTPILLPSDAPP
jgi:hypothetical protein